MVLLRSKKTFFFVLLVYELILINLDEDSSLEATNLWMRMERFWYIILCKYSSFHLVPKQRVQLFSFCFWTIQHYQDEQINDLEKNEHSVH